MEQFFTDKIEEMVKCLLQAKGKNLIYGAGVIARSLERYLQKRGVMVNCFLADAAYYPVFKRNPIPMPLEVLPLEEFFSSAKKGGWNIVPAFSDYDESKLLPYRGKIEKVFPYDFNGALCLYDGGELNIFTPDFLEKHKSDLTEVDNLLADDVSRAELSRYIHQKTYGQRQKPFFPNHYFLPELIRLRDGECFVDCGAYNGDTVRGFLRFAKEQSASVSRIIAFEPDAQNAQKVQSIPIPKGTTLTVFTAGVGSAKGQGTLAGGGTTGASLSVSLGERGGCAVNILTIDEICAKIPVTFLKLDVEGFELEALKGAKETIREYQPRIACSLYHRPEDIFEIIRFLKRLLPQYKFYLRNHAPSATETVLYSLVQRRTLDCTRCPL